MSTNLPRLLAIHGKAYSGKDELARHLADAFGYQPIRIAQPLEDNLHRIFGPLIPEEFRTTRKEDPIPGLNNATWRGLMQSQGWWVRHHFGKTALVKIAKNKAFLGKEGLYLINDVRLEWEAEYLRNAEIPIIHLRRLEAPLARADLTESGIEPMDYEPVFRNDGPLEELFSRVDQWLKISFTQDQEHLHAHP